MYLSRHLTDRGPRWALDGHHLPRQFTLAMALGLPQNNLHQFLQMLASEHREMPGTSARLVEEMETFGDLPLRVIASGVANPAFGADAAGYQQYWIEQSRALASKSSRGMFALAQDSTHRLHTEAADLVVDSILSIVREVRATR